jgi:hypothetical protein
MADHNVNVAWSHDLAGGGDDVAQQRLAANFMQHLGPAKEHGSNRAGRHDDHGQLRVRFHFTTPHVQGDG